MPSYLQLHTRINNMREQAAASTTNGTTAPACAASSEGPRVILLGPTDSGKSSLTRMLLNWGVRSGWEPTFVDLDIGQGSITVPGCVSAVPIEAPLSPEEGASALDLPLVMFYGHASAADNPELYKVCWPIHCRWLHENKSQTCMMQDACLVRHLHGVLQVIAHVVTGWPFTLCMYLSLSAASLTNLHPCIVVAPFTIFAKLRCTWLLLCPAISDCCSSL